MGTLSVLFRIVLTSVPPIFSRCSFGAFAGSIPTGFNTDEPPWARSTELACWIWSAVRTADP